jgi:hypothetical protein
MLTISNRASSKSKQFSSSTPNKVRLVADLKKEKVENRRLKDALSQIHDEIIRQSQSWNENNLTGITLSREYGVLQHHPESRHPHKETEAWEVVQAMLRHHQTLSDAYTNLVRAQQLSQQNSERERKAIEQAWQLKIEAITNGKQQTLENDRQLRKSYQEELQEARQQQIVLNMQNEHKQNVSNIRQEHEENMNSIQVEVAMAHAQYTSKIEELQDQLASQNKQSEALKSIYDARYDSLATMLHTKHAEEKQKMIADIKNREAKWKRDIDSLASALVERDNYKPITDEKLVTRLGDLMGDIEHLTKIEWSLPQTDWTNDILDDISDDRQALQQWILLDEIWNILFENILCSPFRMFGKEGRSLEKDWVHEFEERNGQDLG